MKAASTPSRGAVRAILLAVTAFAALSLQPGAARAQTPDPDAFYQMMSNQLGILKYCKGKGFPSEKAVATYEKYMAAMPAPKDAGKAALYLRKGQEGVIYNGEASQIRLEQMAEGTSQTPEEFCKSYDENAKAFEGTP
ncbi:hypothetical protein [Azospirillum picis]|uniref:Uncharacterized protein n=1 Tax=Azospirillum picis TaxID=488438 RepID=A0ABU0MS94_9PROT|nr:hypothetical protein [Azospirillum picis]MBP2302402.1 hypothetical protein [Azospirillum picis]MDQ0535981.1 hypothetical protein [Azospirillum picis]